MRIILVAGLGLLLAACNQTTQPGPTAAATPAGTSPPAGTEAAEALPPIYEPQIGRAHV